MVSIVRPLHGTAGCRLSGTIKVSHRFDAIIAEHRNKRKPGRRRSTSRLEGKPAKGLPAYWKEVLDAIPNGDRQTRLLVGMALHHATGGSDDGMDTWSSWASSVWNNPEEHEAEWRRFSSDRDDGVTWATVEYLARQEGWQRVMASYADRWAIINVKGKALILDMEEPDIAQALMDERSFLLMHKGDYTTSPTARRHSTGQRSSSIGDPLRPRSSPMVCASNLLAIARLCIRPLQGHACGAIINRFMRAVQEPHQGGVGCWR